MSVWVGVSMGSDDVEATRGGVVWRVERTALWRDPLPTSSGSLTVVLSTENGLNVMVDIPYKKPDENKGQ